MINLSACGRLAVRLRKAYSLAMLLREGLNERRNHARCRFSRRTSIPKIESADWTYPGGIAVDAVPSVWSGFVQEDGNYRIKKRFANW
jgi:hypothetical protein